jgi:hypothetical protein
MKTGTLVRSTQTLPESIQEKIRQAFPDQELSDLVIRYYNTIEDVGYEYFVEKVLPSCTHSPTVQYLEPFISFTLLGETLILSDTESIVIYDSNHDDSCTEFALVSYLFFNYAFASIWCFFAALLSLYVVCAILKVNSPSSEPVLKETTG